MSEAYSEYQNWTSLAACKDAERELFYPPEGKPLTAVQIRLSKAICGRCVVREECLSEALRLGDFVAVLGGTTPRERRKMKNSQPGRD